MKKTTNTPFVKMCRQGIIGAVLGILGGFMLGLIIYVLQYPLMWIQVLSTDSMNIDQVKQMMSWVPVMIPGVLGMSFGAIIGAVFGSIHGLKNNKNE